MFRIATLLVSALSVSAHAENKTVGDYLDASTNPSGVCRLVGVDLTYSKTRVSAARVAQGPSEVFDHIDRRFYCSASLIDPTHVLSAAHCYQGTLEGSPDYTSKPIPKEPRTPQCQLPGWEDDLRCVARVEYYRIDIKMDHVDVECGVDATGKALETHRTDWNMGYPNPRMNAKRVPYDVSVLQVDAKFEKVQPLPILLDAEETMPSILQNDGDCQAYGYGLDNAHNAGVLHGIELPLSLFDSHEEWLVAKDTHQGTQHGDSGGPLFCKDRQGMSKIFGVVSMGGDHGGVLNSAFSVTGYNALWIKRVLALDPSFRHSHANLNDSWHQIAVQYEFDELDRLLNQIDSCIHRRTDFDRKFRRGLKHDYRVLSKARKVKLKQYDRKEIPAGPMRIYLDMIFKNVYEVKDRCENTPS